MSKWQRLPLEILCPKQFAIVATYQVAPRATWQRVVGFQPLELNNPLGGISLLNEPMIKLHFLRLDRSCFVYIMAWLIREHYSVDFSGMIMSEDY